MAFSYAGLNLPASPSLSTKSGEPHVGSACAFIGGIQTVDDALRLAKPEKSHQNNDLLFKLARAIKTLEQKGGRFDQRSLENVFARWCEQARGFLRDGRSREEYFLEFMNAYRRAKFPLGGEVLIKAWEQARSRDIPAEALRFEHPDLRLLIAFLKQMQVLAGTEPFYVTQRYCAQLLGHDTHRKVEKWLGALEALEYIRATERGNSKRATRYRYVWPESEAGI